MKKNNFADIKVLRKLLDKVSDHFYRLSDFSVNPTGENKFDPELMIAIDELESSIKYLSKNLENVENELMKIKW